MDIYQVLNNQNAQGGRPLLFIDKESEEYAIHISFGFVPCIADPANPYYDAKIARKEMIEMFWSYQNVVGQNVAREEVKIQANM